MQYRVLGKTGLEVSVLGFGLMRLPLTSENPGDIDEDEAVAMIERALEGGVTFFDTAYGYHGGNSERLAAKALTGDVRDRIVLASKLPSYLVKEEDDFERFLTEQLEKLGTDRIDVYMLHALTQERWDNVCNLGVTSFLDRALADGRIGHAGFSFHDRIDVFKGIVDAYDWSQCLIQLNFMDQEYQAGLEGLRYAAGRGLGIAVMEPLRGGKLAQNVPAEIEQIWKRSGKDRSPAEWALRWVWNLPEVSVVLSGMSTMEQLAENIRVATDAGAGAMHPAELDLVEQVRQVYERRTKVGCTECGYCVPCPQDVAIPRVFSLLNQASMFDSWPESKRWYGKLLEENKGAPACISCGACEEVCPQHLAISDLLQEAHQLLASDSS